MSNDTGKAKRFNKGKVDLTLLPEVAAYEECKVWMAGQEKYGRDNWKKLWGDESVEVATASLLRHAMSLASGELFDRETGLPHAAHIRCNAAMVLEYMANEKMINHKEYNVDKNKVEENVKVEYTDYRPYYGGSWIGSPTTVEMPETEFEKFKAEHWDAKILPLKQVYGKD